MLRYCCALHPIECDRSSINQFMQLTTHAACGNAKSPGQSSHTANETAQATYTTRIMVSRASVFPAEIFSRLTGYCTVKGYITSKCSSYKHVQNTCCSAECMQPHLAASLAWEFAVGPEDAVNNAIERPVNNVTQLFIQEIRAQSFSSMHFTRTPCIHHGRGIPVRQLPLVDPPPFMRRDALPSR